MYGNINFLSSFQEMCDRVGQIERLISGTYKNFSNVSVIYKRKLKNIEVKLSEN